MQYQLDYNNNHRPISTWNGTTHTDIVYDDYEYGSTDDYAYGDSCNMNDPSVRQQFTQCLKTVQFNNYLQADHIDTTMKHTQAVPDENQSKHATTTTMKETHNDPQPTYKYDTLQLLFLTTHHENIKTYDNKFTLYKIPTYIIKKRNNHRAHDEYLYRRWNTPTAHKHKTKKTRKNQRLSVTKDDTSVTPTLKTLSTIDTHSSHQNNIATDAILNITIWNQSIVQYRTPMPIRPLAPTRNRSRHPSIAVQHALIGVYDKLLHPPNVSCLLPTFTRIVCVVLSCSILLADSFTLVKIDDRYPDEWND